jgi:hypothetical protein
MNLSGFYGTGPRPCQPTLSHAGNTLAYYKHFLFTDVKSFEILGTEANPINLFTAVISESVCPWQAFPAKSNISG